MRSVLFTILLVACAGGPSVVPDAPPIEWESWSRPTFEAARASGRHLLVSVQASWCHWCHVMNDQTFGDPEVRRLVDEGYVAIKVDSDARPDLAERFQDYAWPATVLLSPDAEVVVAMRGYRAPGAFREILRDVREGRAPSTDLGDAPTPAGLREGLRVARSSLDSLYDPEAHGWGRRQKYPYGAPIEHALFRSIVSGESEWRARALSTLEGHAQLLDPVFGGAYQYSLRNGWTHPHYEKIAAVQADVLASFARAAIATGDPRWRARAEDVRRYLERFFTSAEGGFYTSQDADLSHELHGDAYYAMDEEARLAAGIPRIDTEVYPHLNGRLIEALVLMHRIDEDPEPLRMARRAAEHLESTRARDGLFPHGDEPLRHLADQAWMLRAELALHEATGEQRWLDAARRTAAALRILAHAEGGLYAHTEDPEAVGVFARRRRPTVDNAVAARGLIRLSRLTGESSHRELAVAALGAVSGTESLRRLGRKVGEYLMALEELEAPYVLVSVVGPDDERTRALRAAAFRLAHPNRLVELGRPGESRYPYPGAPAAYLCNAEACSVPVSDPSELPAAAERFLSAE